MKILITDLTRMFDGHICAAGIDVDTGKRVRPVLVGRGDNRLDRTLLCTNGGPFDIGRVLDLGDCSHVGRPPEVEDHEFEPSLVRVHATLTHDQFFEVLRANPMDLKAMGPALRRFGGSLATPEGGGDCSLVLRPSGRAPWIGISIFDGRPRIRYRLAADVFLSVTDVRLYEADLTTPDTERVGTLASHLHTGGEVLLSLGLARAWPRGNDPPRHYLQVNNIHAFGWRYWQLCPDVAMFH